MAQMALKENFIERIKKRNTFLLDYIFLKINIINLLKYNI